MSGGSLDYLYERVESAAAEIDAWAKDVSTDPATRLMYERFARHLRLVAKALHDVEWVQSNDYGPGGDHYAIMDVIRRIDVLTAADLRRP